MVDNNGQVPSPSAAGWLLDLASVGGPRYVVLRLEEDAAYEALAQHLTAIGAALTTCAAERLVAAASAEPLGVVW